MNDHDRNLRIAETICEQFSWDGQTFAEGSYLALLDGKVVAVAATPDDAISALRALNPDPACGMVIEVARPVVDVIR